MANTVEFYGEKFTLAESISEFALMEFAEAAADGEDGDTMQGMASMLRLIRGCIVDDDWAGFRKLARENRADTEALLPVLKAAMEQAADRPTMRSSDSSGGPRDTPERSVSLPADPGTELFAGRPDLQLALARTLAS